MPWLGHSPGPPWCSQTLTPRGCQGAMGTLGSLALHGPWLPRFLLAIWMVGLLSASRTRRNLWNGIFRNHQRNSKKLCDQKLLLSFKSTLATCATCPPQILQQMAIVPEAFFILLIGPIEFSQVRSSKFAGKQKDDGTNIQNFKTSCVLIDNISRFSSSASPVGGDVIVLPWKSTMKLVASLKKRPCETG